jgi:transcriptional regulator with XRE-family HTH domain
MSVRGLADQAEVSQPYLSRLLRGADYKKTPSLRVARAVAEALELEADYFAEYREQYVVEQVRKSPRLRDELYDTLKGRRRRRS